MSWIRLSTCPFFLLHHFNIFYGQKLGAPRIVLVWFRICPCVVEHSVSEVGMLFECCFSCCGSRKQRSSSSRGQPGQPGHHQCQPDQHHRQPDQHHRQPGHHQ